MNFASAWTLSLPPPAGLPQVTLKGNAGTVFVEAQTKYWQTITAAPLSKKMDAEAIRTLDVGELFKVLEGPKEEKSGIVQRLRGRALKDGIEGWLTLRPDNMKPWSAVYSCLEAVWPLLGAMSHSPNRLSKVSLQIRSGQVSKSKNKL